MRGAEPGWRPQATGRVRGRGAVGARRRRSCSRSPGWAPASGRERAAVGRARSGSAPSSTPGVQPTLHPDRAAEPRRPAALRHRDGEPAGGGVAPPVRPDADGGDPGRRPGRPGHRQQPAVRVARRTVDRLLSSRASSGRSRWKAGPPIDLAVCDWAGGSWGRNGQLVYSPSYNTGLWMVSEGGGDERMLTAPDTAKGELGHWWPQILPDGDHVIFTAYRTPIERGHDRGPLDQLRQAEGAVHRGRLRLLRAHGAPALCGRARRFERSRSISKRLAVTGTADPGGGQRRHEPHRRRGGVRRFGERDAGVPAGQLLRHRERRGAGGPAGQRVAGASRQRPLQPSRASRRTGAASRWTSVRPTRWETSGCSRWAARAGPGSPRKAAGTSAPSGRPTAGS